MVGVEVIFLLNWAHSRIFMQVEAGPDCNGHDSTFSVDSSSDFNNKKKNMSRCEGEFLGVSTYG